MRAQLRSFAKRALFTLGGYRVYRSIAGPRGARLVVLMYHDILSDVERTEVPALDIDSPSASEFAAHVREIGRRHRVLSMRDVVREMQTGGLRKDTVVITFDDGYESVYSIAYPALRELGLPATLFVLTGWMSRHNTFWWQELRAVVARSRFEGVSPEALRDIVPAWNSDSPRRSDPGMRFRRRFLEHTEREFRSLHDTELQDRLSALRGLLMPGHDAVPVRDTALSWDQVRELGEHGFELAAHTQSHVNLRYTDRSTAEREILQSREEVERHAGCKVVGFAYPYGGHPAFDWFHVRVHRGYGQQRRFHRPLLPPAHGSDIEQCAVRDQLRPRPDVHSLIDRSPRSPFGRRERSGTTDRGAAHRWLIFPTGRVRAIAEGPI
jgi:peptidoglycan/xylan/chitin deacetylase (PgdA/CDA1 family)